MRLRRSALRKGSAFPGLGYSSDFLVYGEAAPRRVRRSLTANDKADLGATERQSFSAKQAAEPQVIPQPFLPALTVRTGQPSRRRSRKSSAGRAGRHRDKLSSSIKWPSSVHFVLDNCRP